MPKLLTIVIPAYNSEMTINATLLSLDYQCGKYFDVLIIDDESTKPLQPYIQAWIDRFPKIIKCVRQENNNWGGCVNYATKYVKTKYIKILDSDDTFFTEDMQNYLEHLRHVSKNNVDVVINSFGLNDIKTNNIEKRSYNLKKKIIYSDFDNLKFTKILTMHALTLSLSLLRKMKPLPTKTSYTDNLLVFQSVLYSKSVALLPRDIFVYNYRFGDLNQSMSWNKTVKNLPKIKNIYHDMFAFNINDLSTKRTKSLTNIIKQMFYLICLIISLDNDIYKWQKQKQINHELSYIKQYIHDEDINKIINTGYLKIINRRSIPLIMKINKLVLLTSQVGFIKMFRLQYKESKNEKIRT